MSALTFQLLLRLRSLCDFLKTVDILIPFAIVTHSRWYSFFGWFLWRRSFASRSGWGLSGAIFINWDQMILERLSLEGVLRSFGATSCRVLRNPWYSRCLSNRWEAYCTWSWSWGLLRTRLTDWSFRRSSGWLFIIRITSWRCLTLALASGWRRLLIDSGTSWWRIGWWG